MTLVIACFELITALQHSCTSYCCLLGGMCSHFKFPSIVCRLYIAYHEYSMIDPSGTLITGTSLLWAATFACWLDRWRGVVSGVQVVSCFFYVVKYIVMLLTRPLWSFYWCFKLVDFMVWTGFSWACGAMPNMSSVFRHSLGCIYIYTCMYIVVQLILVLQVAVVCFCLVAVCSVCCLVSLFCFGFGLKWIESVSPITST